MQRKLADAEPRYRAVIGTVTSDAGLMMDRARYLRANGYESHARDLARAAAQFHLSARPIPSASTRCCCCSPATRRRLGSGRPPTISPARSTTRFRRAPTSADQPIGIRDDYTSLAWLAGTVALDRLNRPANAIAMFDRYARGGRRSRSRPRAIIGPAARRSAAGRVADANSYFQRAAAYPELFYGQLALERLGPLGRRPAAVPSHR